MHFPNQVLFFTNSSKPRVHRVERIRHDLLIALKGFVDRRNYLDDIHYGVVAFNNSDDALLFVLDPCIEIGPEAQMELLEELMQLVGYYGTELETDFAYMSESLQMVLRKGGLDSASLAEIDVD